MVWTNVSNESLQSLLGSLFFSQLFIFSIKQIDELDEINCYAQRISNRLSTVDICVKTVRDGAQEEALHQVNIMIDSLITFNDRVMARQRCQTFLNACSVHDEVNEFADIEQMLDKRFENAVLGCTLDDQKIIKKRLLALMAYLNKQTVSDWAAVKLNLNRKTIISL